MMSLTEDGMLNPELVKKRDADYGISTEASSQRPPVHAVACFLPSAVRCINTEAGRRVPRMREAAHHLHASCVACKCF
jgi:hypothetical protein